MRPIPRLCLLAIASAVLLSGDDPSWKEKSIRQWDDQNAKQVLDDSPWVKSVKLERVRDLSKFESRDGGNMSAGNPPCAAIERDRVGHDPVHNLREAPRAFLIRVGIFLQSEKQLVCLGLSRGKLPYMLRGDHSHIEAPNEPQSNTLIRLSVKRII